MFFQRRNETIISPGEIQRRKKSSCSAGRPAPPSSCAHGMGGGVELRSHLSAIVLVLEVWGRDGTALVGCRTAVCRYDWLRSEARCPAAAGGSAADCGRHHHRAPLHRGSQLGKKKYEAAEPETHGGFYAAPCSAHRAVGAQLFGVFDAASGKLGLSLTLHSWLQLPQTFTERRRVVSFCRNAF